MSDDLRRRIRSLQATSGALGQAVAAMAAHKTKTTPDLDRLFDDLERLWSAEADFSRSVRDLHGTVDELLAGRRYAARVASGDETDNENDGDCVRSKQEKR